MAYHKPFKRSIKVIIQGYPCYLPPPGWGINEAGNLLKIGIHRRHPNTRYQWWEPIFDPVDYKKRRKVEIEIQQTDPNYRDPDLDKIRKREWTHRLYGFWFKNKGVSTYITGPHYFFLTHHFVNNKKTPHGFPSFWEDARELYYKIQAVSSSPLMGGTLFSTRRRWGKSEFTAAWLHERISRKRYSTGLIQSKNERDAKQVIFAKKFINGYKKTPDFFKLRADPIYVSSKGSDSQVIKASSRIGFVGAPMKPDDHDWGGMVEAMPSNVMACDGYDPFALVQDEIFKSSRIDVRARHDVNLFTLKDENEEFHGKMLATSTVEEIKGKIQDYRSFWHNSTPESINPTLGFNETRLITHFVSSEFAENRDEYGHAPWEANRLAILEERDLYKHNVKNLFSFIRKKPLAIEEAFRTAEGVNNFNVVAIQKRIEELTIANKIESVTVGRFEFINTPIADPGAQDNKDCRVKFVPDPTGKWKLKGYPYKNFDPNSWQLRSNRLFPTHEDVFTIGVDPYASDVVQSGTGSNGAIYVLEKFKTMKSMKEDRLIGQYIGRPPTVQGFALEILKASLYFSTPALIEKNRPGAMQHIKNVLDFDEFLMYIPGQKEPGISTESSKKTLRELIDAWNSVIDGGGLDEVDFVEVLIELLDFDPTQTQKFDAVMAAGIAMIAANRSFMTPKVSSGQNKSVAEFFGIK